MCKWVGLKSQIKADILPGGDDINFIHIPRCVFGKFHFPILISAHKRLKTTSTYTFWCSFVFSFLFFRNKIFRSEVIIFRLQRLHVKAEGFFWGLTTIGVISISFFKFSRLLLQILPIYLGENILRV